VADTFESIWREVRLHSPAVPNELIQNWTRDRFRDLIDRRFWSWAFSRSQFNVQAAYSTGSVTVTNNSTTVTGSGTLWNTGSAVTVGMQFKCRNYVYTVTTVTSDTSIEIDQKWGGSTTSGSNYMIVQAYVTVPTDFKAFHTIIDPENNWRLWWNYSAREIDAWDPARTSTGNPSILAIAGYNATSNLPQYELWPHQINQKAFTFMYYKISPDFGEGISLPYAIRGDVIKRGVLADMCRYPGTGDAPNKCFNMKLAETYEARWENGVRDMERNDQEIYLTDAWYSDTMLPYAPLDSKFYQTHSF